MVLATILLMLPVPQIGDVTKTVANAPAAISADAKDTSGAADALPSMPTPKAVSESVDPSTASGLSTVPVNSSTSSAEGSSSNPGSFRFESVKAAYTRPRETSAQRKEWYALLVTSHAAAAFDAWSTRRAVVQGYTEANPLLRPFANSNAIYVATQVSPVVMDYLGKRMMVSQHGWIRKMWWVPQVAGSGLSIGAGVHNVGIVH